jgi:enamine deaminase RidA (YjgF/YER057c/UK114 family)
MTMPHKIHNIDVAAQIGAYSDAVETAPNLRWLFTSGTPGLEIKGNLPSDIAGQSELAWKHILRILEQDAMCALSSYWKSKSSPPRLTATND